MIYAIVLLGSALAGDEAALRSALLAAEARQPANLPIVDNAVLDYASFLQQRGRFREAEPLYLRSQELNRTLYGPKSHEAAVSLLRLGALHHASFQFAQAEIETRAALDLLQTCAGEASLEYAWALANLAANLAAQGENARAEPVLRRAVFLVRKRMPQDNPMVASLETNLGLIYLRQGEIHQARPLLEGSLTSYAAANHPGQANALAAIGELDVTEGRWPEAERHIGDAYRLALVNEGENGPSLAGILRLRAIIHGHNRKFGQACEDLKRSIGLMDALAGEGSNALLPFLESYVRMLRKTSQREQAKTAQQRVRLLRKSMNGSGRASSMGAGL